MNGLPINLSVLVRYCLLQAGHVAVVGVVVSVYGGQLRPGHRHLILLVLD